MTAATDAYSLDLDAPIDYEPEPPLDIDVRPFEDGQLRRWRKECRWRRTLQTDVAEALGISTSTYAYWERGDKTPSPPWRALIREWYVDDIDITYDSAPLWMGKSLAALVGGWRVFCPLIGYHRRRFGNWVTRGEIPKQQGVGALVRWLYEELQPERVDDLRSDAVCVHADIGIGDVREIRRRLKDGEAVMDLADEFDSTPTNIRQIRDRETWRWVE